MLVTAVRGAYGGHVEHQPPRVILEQSQQQKARAQDLVRWAVGTADQARLATDQARLTVQSSRRLVARINRGHTAGGRER